MHKEFADWYRQAGVAPSGDLLAGRWSGVSALSEKLSKQQLLDLLQLYCRDPGDAFETPSFLDEAFRAHDATFPARGNVLELRILAGCIVRMTIEADKAPSIAAAYGLLCGTFGISADSVPTAAHVEFAEAFLISKSERVRELQTIAPARVATTTKEKLEALLPAESFAQIASLREPLIASLLDVSERERQATNKQMAALWQLLNAQREELDMLWWLQNAYSRELGRAFNQMSVAEGCLVMAVELAAATRFLPGPASILGMIITSLSQLKGDDKISLKHAVNNLPRQWREARVSSVSAFGLNPICPTYLALAASLETEGEDDWLPVFYKRSRLNADDARSAAEISYQGYRETLFLKAFAELK